jgi:hypothetical protein
MIILTPQDELAIKNLLATSRPMPVMNPRTGRVPQISEAAAMAQIMRSVTGPLPVLAGAAAKGTLNGVPRPAPRGEDPQLLERTKHVRRKNERMGRFYARVGLGAAQILAMTPDEISRFCEIAEENNSEVDSAFSFDAAGKLSKYPAFEPRPRGPIVIDTW